MLMVVIMKDRDGADDRDDRVVSCSPWRPGCPAMWFPQPFWPKRRSEVIDVREALADLAVPDVQPWGW